MLSSNKEFLNFGIIGCGHIVQSVHMPAWKAIKSVQLQAVCDTNEPAMNRIAPQGSNIRRYTNIDEFLDYEKSLDFVVLATPGDSHGHIGEKIITNKINLLCEKPLALNQEDAKHLYDLADEHGVVLTPIQNYKFRDTVMKAFEYKDNGLLGSITSVTIRSRSGFISREPTKWRAMERQQRVLLFDYGIHFIQLALQFVGPVSALKFVESRSNSAGLEHVVFGTTHQEGASCLFELMLDSPSSTAEIEIMGRERGVSLDFFPHGCRVLPSRDNPVHRGLADSKRLLTYVGNSLGERFLMKMADRAVPHYRLFSQFVEHLQGVSSNPVSPEEILPTLSLLDSVANKVY